MTRYQPDLRPITSANADFRPSFARSWRKHSSRARFSSRGRGLRQKPRAICLASSQLEEMECKMVDISVVNQEKITQKSSQGTQTIESPNEQFHVLESPTVSELYLEKKAGESGKHNMSRFPEHLQRKHARRQCILERVEKDLEHRSFSQSDFHTVALSESLRWQSVETLTEEDEYEEEQESEMAPLMSEPIQETNPTQRGRFLHTQQDFYASEETDIFPRALPNVKTVREISPTRDRGTNYLPSSKRGKLVTFYINGDPFYRGFTTSVNERDFRNFQTLLEWLTERMKTRSGVRFVFSLDDGRQIRNVEDFKHSRGYVVSGLNKLDMSCTYGPKKLRVWSMNAVTAEKIRNDDLHLFQVSGNGNTLRLSPTSKRPRILTIISNLDRSSREKLILNPQTSLTFEELLSDLTSLIRVPRPPVKALYTEQKPHGRVQSYSQLLREYKDHVNFIACGEEGKPMEMSSKRHAPGSNSSTESTISNPIRKPRKYQKQMYSASETTQSRTDMSIDVSTGHVDTPFPGSGKPLAAIEPGKTQSRGFSKLGRKNETVRLSIHGRKKEFHAPSVFDSDDDGAKPDKVLKLDWVYGYRGKDARCNLFVIPTSGELLYFMGAVAVLYNRRKETQRHYCGHSEDITSMALHPGKRLVASGQQAGKTPDSASHVRIWDTISLSTYSIIGLGFFQAGVSSVSFSVESQGDFVLVVDDGDKHTLSVWDWQNSKLAAKTTTTTDMVVWGRFHNLDDSILVTYGKRHIFFWKLNWTSREEGEGRIVRNKESGIFRDEIPKFVTSLAFSPLGDVVVGDSNGSITVWSRDETDAFRINHACSDHTRNAHKKSVFTLCFLEDGTLLSGGGSEIKTWDSENYYRMIKERALPDTAGYIRTLVPVLESDAEGPLYIGTTKNYVLEGSLQHKFKFVVQGHSDKLWALSVHPKEPCFFTAGFDLQVCRWSTIMHTAVWRMQVETPCISMATDPSGKLVVVGTVDGNLIVMSAGNGTNISTTQVCLDKINVVQFSPNGLYLSVGCQDGTVCLYEVMDDGFYLRKIGNLQGHKNAVTHLDWSSDNKFLQTVSADYDLFFWDVEEINQVTAVRSMRDVDWSTQTCTLSYNIIGPWTNLKPGEDIRCVCRSTFREYMCVGTNGGSVQLYKYPSSAQKALCYAKKSFSSSVTSVQFAMEDRYLISAGGNDAVLVQWAVKPLLS